MRLGKSLILYGLLLLLNLDFASASAPDEIEIVLPERSADKICKPLRIQSILSKLNRFEDYAQMPGARMTASQLGGLPSSPVTQEVLRLRVGKRNKLPENQVRFWIVPFGWIEERNSGENSDVWPHMLLECSSEMNGNDRMIHKCFQIEDPVGVFLIANFDSTIVIEENTDCGSGSSRIEIRIVVKTKSEDMEKLLERIQESGPLGKISSVAFRTTGLEKVLKTYLNLFYKSFVDSF